MIGKLCSSTLKYNGGTTSAMRAHLTLHEKKNVAVAVSSKSLKSDAATPAPRLGQSSLTTFLNRTVCSSKRQREITEHIVDWCTSSLRPASIVRDRGLINLLNFLEPGYKVPSHTAVVNNIRHRYEELRAVLKAELENVDGLSITTDLWSSSRNVDYGTYTGHYIDTSWCIRSVVIETPEFSERHTAQNIIEALETVLENAGVDASKKLVSLVSDEAANMVAAIRFLQKKLPSMLTVFCACHRLQTALRHVMDLPSVLKALGACRRLVGHFKHSNVASQALRERQNQSKQVYGLVSEVATRWNNVYDMLQRLSVLRVPITAVLNDTAVTKPSDRNLCLSAAQWTSVEELCEVLRSFRDVTVMWSSEHDVTVSTILPAVVGLNAECETDDRDSLFIYAIKAKLRSELDRKFHLSSVDPSSAEALATAIDPCYRSLMFLSENDRQAIHEQLEQMVRKCSMLRILSSKPDCCPDEDEGVAPAAKRARTAGSPPSPELTQKTSLLARLTGKHKFKAASKRKDELTGTDQLKLYFDGDECDIDSSPLEWWKARESSFPDLAPLAKRILSIPASSTAAERNFSVAGIVTDKRRANLGSRNINAILFLNKNSKVLGCSSCTPSQNLNPHATLNSPGAVPPLPELPLDISDDSDCEVEC